MKKNYIALLLTFVLGCTKTKEVYPELPSIQFQATSKGTFQESLGESITFTIALSGTSSADETVNLNFSGSATKDVDYEVITPLPLKITKGQTSATIQIKVLKDNVFESGSENVVISMSNLNQTVKLGEKSVMEFTIYDGQALLGFETIESETVESFEIKKVKITLDKPLSHDLIAYVTVTEVENTNKNLFVSLDTTYKYENQQLIIIKAGATFAYAYFKAADYSRRENQEEKSTYKIKLSASKYENVSIDTEKEYHKVTILDYQRGLLISQTDINVPNIDFFSHFHVADENNKLEDRTQNGSVNNGKYCISKYLPDGDYYFWHDDWPINPSNYSYGTHVTGMTYNFSVGSNLTNNNNVTFTFKDNLYEYTRTKFLKITKKGTEFTVTELANSN